MPALKRTYSASKKMPAYKAQKTTRKSQIASRYGNERVHYVKRTVDMGPIVTDRVNPTLIGFNFSLTDVDGNAELISMYDQYKICGVLVRMWPKQTQSITLGTLDTPNACRYFTAIDYTDSTAPTAISVMREYENCKVHGILEKSERYIKNPKYQDTSNGQVQDTWLATSSAASNWNGFKFAAEATGNTGTGNQTFVLEATYYMCFKNIK